jgi:hypothetical protein
MTATRTAPPRTPRPMNDVGRFLQREDAEARRLYRLYPEAFTGLDIPDEWRCPADMSRQASPTHPRGAAEVQR